MTELLGVWVIEAVNFAALWVHARHEVVDRAVLARGVHRLENEEQRMTAVRVAPALEGLNWST